MSRGEPEVGSVIENRVSAMAEANQKIALGHTARICVTCRKPWLGPAICGQNGCRSIEFEDRDVRVTPMVIESMPAPNKASATALLERQVKVEVQSKDDLVSLHLLREQLEGTVQELLVADETMHRILGRIPLDIAAVFQETGTARERFERDARMQDVNREIWFDLQSTIHFAAEALGDTPLGGSVPFRASLALQCRHVISEINRAIQKYENALKEQK
jgi:hypothetical protein